MSYAGSKGDMGWQSAEQLPASILKNISLMQMGEVSNVFHDQQGFHIVKLIETRGGKRAINQLMHVRHILIKTNGSTDNNVARTQITKIRNRIIAGEDFATLAKAVSQDQGSASSGGDLGWSSPSAYVPAFSATMKKTPVNAISQPFKSRFGWHILQVLGKKQEDQTDQVLKNQAKEILSKSKLDTEYKKWLQRLRNEAFVEYRIAIK